MTGRRGAITRYSDERHSRGKARCGIKWTVAILDSPVSPHDPTQPPPKRRAGPSFHPRRGPFPIGFCLFTGGKSLKAFWLARGTPILMYAAKGKLKGTKGGPGAPMN